MPRSYSPEFRRKVLGLVETGRPVARIAQDLDISDQTIYTWRRQHLHTVSKGVYGACRIHAELTLGLGIQVGHNAVEKLMRRAEIRGLPGNRRRKSRHETPAAGDLVHRAFNRDRRDQQWVTDITEHHTREGKVYCAVVLDTFSRWVVGWSIDSTQTAALVASALDMAIRHRNPDPKSGLIIHSDHGVSSRPGPSPSAPAPQA